MIIKFFSNNSGIERYFLAIDTKHNTFSTEIVTGGLYGGYDDVIRLPIKEVRKIAARAASSGMTRISYADMEG